MILLIHPPAAKPCEPPAGIARLSGLFHERRVRHRIFDANIEGMLHLLSQQCPTGKDSDTWTKRAFRNLGTNVSGLRDTALYRSCDRYSRAVKDLGRALAAQSPSGISLSLANYEDQNLSPLRSTGLIQSAERPEQNPFFPFFSQRLREIFREEEPAIAGISLNYLSQALTAFSMIGFLKREYPSTKVVLGGGLVTTWMSATGWKDPFSGLVDHLVSGPGEDRLLLLLGLSGTNGAFPRPEYRGLPMKDYLSPGFVLPYAASSGCHWNKCAFCPEKAEGSRYRPVPLPQVSADLDALIRVTGPALVHILDNAISPAQLADFAARPFGVPWYGFARIGHGLTDPDFCRALRESGCVMLKLGIESGDQDVLDALGKGISIDDASIVLKNLRKAGIASYVYLMFGTPAESAEAARETLDFTARHADCIGFLNLAVFNLPRHSALWPDMPRREFSEGDLSLYADFEHPKGWDRKNVRSFLEREFKRHPAVASILRREPPVFTSNHAPFFMTGTAGKRPASFTKDRARLHNKTLKT